MDVVFLFERLLQLEATMHSGPSHALFGSPLFLHLLVERFAVAFEGLDAELFKLESDELCHAEGVYETCLLIRDKIDANKPESELTKFLAAFKIIFEQDEPKDCWDAFYDLYRINDVSFRRDMKRALNLMEAVTLGPTKIALAFPSKDQTDSKRRVPRALLEKRYEKEGREQEEEQEQEAQQSEVVGNNDAPDEAQRRGPGEHVESSNWVWSTRVPISLNGEVTTSSLSEVSDEPVVAERPVSSKPPRSSSTARVARQESRRSVQRPDTSDDADTTELSLNVPAKRKARKRWSTEEEEALLEGYRLYGSYKNVWVLIKTRFPGVLQNRSNVDLKDKYRNMLRYGKIPQVGATADA
ncbi:hypothetical protein JM18_005195 [Phytophthora kernoviae]|uniref:Myb-like domain-containing protein n=2 Tax=Phytophthora kernoviae TaxID=325452 RepID=A0A8T0LXE5_9STRA|nr:hypothetical protein G195_007869 [Phytophthora kernoviae 00238/432]KAG2523163.1 hypothetical protein JM16_005421 [Phytophthora kernoviae]KAG2524860.1 hypothetical protein JM18_005195 [Phytophthora kernoviae]